MWVYDEVQLMGAGLATTAQLHAFRDSLGAFGNPRSLWMSATLDRDWLRTVDLDPISLGSPLQLSERDKADSSTYSAYKPLCRATSAMGDIKAVAEEVLAAHQANSRTLVIVNTVARAIDILKHLSKQKPQVKLVLIHSRFRPPERIRKIEQLLAEPGPAGTLIVSTQVVEAGVDISVRTLFTELAPWASLVQRFGRCNRRGEYGDDNHAAVFWLDLPDTDQQQEELGRPYDLDELRKARELLSRCNDGVGSQALNAIEVKLVFKRGHVLRRKDLVDLFDTTPDLGGNDIDIDRYVRDTDASDVRVFWREFGDGSPARDEPLPARDELCPVRIGQFRQFLTKLSKLGIKVYRRNFLDRVWEAVAEGNIYSGQSYMLPTIVGGYDEDLGWTGDVAKKKEQAVPSLKPPTPASSVGIDGDYEDDLAAQINAWQTLSEHSDDLRAEMQVILHAVGLSERLGIALLTAARWHDLGKRHYVFQDAIKLEHDRHGLRPEPFRDRRDLAKAPGPNKKTGDRGWWKRYERKHFRHELASALAVLQESHGQIPDELRDLIAYLVAAHHGKVRLSIRSMPDELRPHDEDGKPQPDRLFARGVWDGDVLPESNLGGGVILPAIKLSLEPMQLGLSDDGQPSWAERMLGLRDDPQLGPFRLAHLEALLRAADMRVSKHAAEKT